MTVSFRDKSNDMPVILSDVCVDRKKKSRFRKDEFNKLAERLGRSHYYISYYQLFAEFGINQKKIVARVNVALRQKYVVATCLLHISFASSLIIF